MVFVFPPELVVQKLKIKIYLAKCGEYTECFDCRIRVDPFFFLISISFICMN